MPLEDLQVAQKFTDFRTANRLSWSYRKDPAPAFSEARLEEQKATLKEVEKAKLEVLCRNREDLWVHKYHSPRAERELFNKKEKGKGKETEKEEVNEKEKEKETEKK